MEQLTGDAIRLLVEKAQQESGPFESPRAPRLWARGDRSSGWQAPAPGPLTDRTGLGDELSGIERRLVRRAEALWASLRPESALPPAAAAPLLLAPPFAGQAMLVSLPAAGEDEPRVSYVGEALAALARISTGVAHADSRPDAPLADRLVALAMDAAAAGQPQMLDSDHDILPPAARKPHMLMRAIALPLAPDPAWGSGQVGVVVASWRKLLSSEETAALHRELAAAIDWMKGSSG